MSDGWTHTPNDPLLSAAEIAALGQIVVIWGHIEADLQHIIWEYLGGDAETGATITSGLMLEPKCRLLGELAKLRENVPKQQDSLVELLKRIERLRPTRNDIIHGYWIGAAPKSYKKDLKAGIHPYDFDSAQKIDLLSFRDQSSTLAHDIWRFMGTTMILRFPVVPEPIGPNPNESTTP